MEEDTTITRPRSANNTSKIQKNDSCSPKRHSTTATGEEEVLFDANEPSNDDVSFKLPRKGSLRRCSSFPGSSKDDEILQASYADTMNESLQNMKRLEPYVFIPSGGLFLNIPDKHEEQTKEKPNKPSFVTPLSLEDSSPLEMENVKEVVSRRYTGRRRACSAEQALTLQSMRYGELNCLSLSFDDDNEEDDDDIDENVGSFSGSFYLGRPRGPTTLTLGNLMSSFHGAKEKTQRVAKEHKDAFSRFQKNGGFVKWLHGEDENGASNMEEVSNESVTQKSSGVLRSNNNFWASAENEVVELAVPNSTRIIANISGVDKQVKSDTMNNLNDLSNLSVSTTTTSAPASTTTSTNVSPVRSSLGQFTKTSSLFENLKDRFKKAPSDLDGLIGGRHSIDGADLGFEDNSSSKNIVSAASGSSTNASANIGTTTAASKSSRRRITLRSFRHALIESKKRSFSADGEVSVGLKAELPSKEEHFFPLSMEECLVDPKMAAEFINTMMPEDASVLMLLYSIEEFEKFVSNEPLPALHIQVALATNIMENFFIKTSNSFVYCPILNVFFESKKNIPLEIKQTLDQTIHASNVLALPKTLFTQVYVYLQQELKRNFIKFKDTKEYNLLVEQFHFAHHSTINSSTIDTLTLEDILQDEWYTMVYWMYLYRTNHHLRLSFLMEMNFKVLPIYQQWLQENNTILSNQKLVQTIQSLACKFLQQNAPMELFFSHPTGGIIDIQKEIVYQVLEAKQKQKKFSSDWFSSPSFSSSFDFNGTTKGWIEMIMEKLFLLSKQVQYDFKRHCFERFCSFLSSSLYHEFIESSLSSSSVLVQSNSNTTSIINNTSSSNRKSRDLIQLLRKSRICFHQPPIQPFVTNDITNLLKKKPYGSNLVQCFFSFSQINAKTNVALEPFQYKILYEKNQMVEEDTSRIIQRLEHFLFPETSTKTTRFDLIKEEEQEICFHFITGNHHGGGNGSNGGEPNCLYGFVWRLTQQEQQEQENRIVTKGLCLLSRYPLGLSLRKCFQFICPTKDQAMDLFTSSSQQFSQKRIEAAQAQVEKNIFSSTSCTMTSTPTSDTIDPSVFALNDHKLPEIDVDLQDLFDCLSISHVIHLFTCVLMEKKIVLISSSYSILFYVGESLRNLLFPLLWSHLYVPVLPFSMKEYLQCPTPFLFGLHQSYTNASDLPCASDDFVIVNLDHDSIQGGGEIGLPRWRKNQMEEKLFLLLKQQHILKKDCCFSYQDKKKKGVTKKLTQKIRHVFYTELKDLLDYLKLFSFHFEYQNKIACVVMDTSTSTPLHVKPPVCGSQVQGQGQGQGQCHWTKNSDTIRFHSILLQTQSFSTYLSSSSSSPSSS